MDKTRLPVILTGIACLLFLHKKVNFRNTPIYPTNSDEKSDHETIISLQSIRKQVITNTCINHKLLKPSYKSNILPNHYRFFLVDDKREIIYCWIPKVGCTNWKLALVKYSGNMTQKKLDHMNQKFVSLQNYRFKLLFGLELNLPMNQGDYLHSEQLYQSVGLKDMKYLTPEAISSRLNTYFKFVFVRDPFNRLYSAFKDKFMKESITGLRRRLGPMIINAYRNSTGKMIKPHCFNLTNTLEKKRSISKWKRRALQPEEFLITFEEFLRYVGDNHTDNLHWAPQHSLSRACSVQFDFVGKFENLIQESSYVFSLIFGDSKMGQQFFTRSADHGPSHSRVISTAIPGGQGFKGNNIGKSSSSGSADPYKDIPESVLEKVRKVYALDFEMFGYDPYRIKGI